MWWSRFGKSLARILFARCKNQFLDAREELKNDEQLQKFWMFSTNGRTFVKHHLFNQVWWLEITTPMHNKNSTIYIFFRSYQLCALPFCHACRQASASKWLPRCLQELRGKKLCCPAYCNFHIFTYQDRQSNGDEFKKRRKSHSFLIKNKFKWWKGYFICMFSSVKHKIIY